MATESACLLIADISGYTRYLAGVELDHAQDILADLMGTIVTTLRPTFRLAKLEGDAAFMFAVTGEDGQLDGSLLLDTVERCYFGFRRRRRDVGQATSCECNACVRIPDLNLKFVVHHGLILRQEVAGLEELIGADVILVHRLLKNAVVETTGIEAYAVFSQQCVDAMDVDVAALGLLPMGESYEHIGDVALWVHDLEARWQDEEQRTRVRVEEADAVYTVRTPTAAPPQLAWEFLTAPGRRIGWQVGATALSVTAPGNRRGTGSTNHCVHGPDTILEEILDWRPFDYLTDRTSIPTPMGPVRFLVTVELEPTPDGGTVIHHRFAAPETEAERQVLDEMIGPLDESMRASSASLAAQLEIELRLRGADVGAEPDLPSPSPRSPFAGLAPSS